MVINSFRDQHRFLSNFHQCPFEYDGLTYPNAEAAFQAQKCSDLAGRIRYTHIKNPVIAKRLGRHETLPADWDATCFDLMNAILHQKFANPELAQLLLATGDAYLEEGNHWHDNRWGRCTCDKCRANDGQNWLGKILMNIRDELRARPRSTQYYFER